MTASPGAERWARLQDLFHAALERAPETRAGFLREACAAEPALLAEIQSLLDAHEETGPVARLLPPSPAPPFERVGPYRILSTLGEGGMATVYLAEREGADFTQLVAVKLSRTGVSDRVPDRLRGERRILAGLEHPGIARLIDGGATPEGRPFCAMEFVDGPNLLDYADRQLLTVAQRLQLFLEVCEAVHYAHQQLVVHRDLKPSNILVTPEGRAKLLDFGIAKLLDAAQQVDPSIRPTHTAAWFTPAYASPEQVRGEPVTTLTDVYALGVLLYELLVGSLPYEVTARSPAEIERIVCEVIPDQPSAAAGRMPPDVAQARRATPERIRRQLTGDLDTIVMKALAKEASRRYASVERLAEDLRRFLAGHPVTARPDRLGYRAGKFVRRHRTAVLAAGLATLSLLGGIAATAWQAARARRERDRAARALIDAQRALVQSEDVTGFLVGLFRNSDPMLAPGNARATRELLRYGVEQAAALAAQPAVQARILDVLGEVYANLGDFDQARSLLERALALRRASLGEDHVDVALSLDHLGTLSRRLAGYATAESLYLAALAIERRALGDSDIAVARTLSNLGYLMPYLARLEESETYYRRALVITRRVRGPDAPEVGYAVARLGEAVARQGRRVEAESLFRDVVAARRRASARPDPALADALLSLADVIAEDSGRGPEAESLYREALAIQRRTLGERHPLLSHALDGLSDVLAARGAFAEAERLQRDVLAIRQAALGPDHTSVAEALGHLAGLMERQGRLPEALALRRQALTLWRRTFGPEHHAVASALTDVAVVLTGLDRFDEAEQTFQSATAMRLRVSGPDHPLLAYTFRRHAELRIRRADYPGAEQLLERALAVLRRKLPPEHPQVRSVYGTMAALYDAWGRPEDARRCRALAARPAAR